MKTILLLLIAVSVWSVEPAPVVPMPPNPPYYWEQGYFHNTRHISIETGETKVTLGFRIPSRDVSIKIYDNTSQPPVSVLVEIERIAVNQFVITCPFEIPKATIVFYSKQEWVTP